MPTRSKLLSLVLAALMVFAFTPVLAQFSPAIYAVDQDVVDGVVRVTRATSDGPGWVVIHADDAGAPGPVIGYVAVPSGISANVEVQIEDEAAITPVLHAMLHEDSGAEGTYEFPDGDPPVQVNDAIVMVPLNVTATGHSLQRVIADQADLSTLFAAIEAAGMAGEFTADGGPYTVFAPSNDAFAALPEGELDALLADPEALGGVLSYHLLPGVVTSDLITESMEAETINGPPVAIEVADGAVTVNGANVTTADLEAFNGVVHIIDAVLLPPAAEEAAAEEAPAEEATPEPVDMVDTAIAAGGFDTLVAAVQAAGLENALRSGTYTVFAPTDEAFAALPAGTVEALLEDPAALKAVIYNHMVGGIRGSDVFTDGLELRTPRGQMLTLTAADGGYMVGDANIVATDVAAANGVIHAIDKVLIPANIELPGAAAETGAAEATAEPTEEAAAEATAEPTAEPTEEATPEPTEEAAAAPAELPATGAAKQETGDIVDTAAGVGNLDLVLQAAQAVGLDDTLRGEGPYTIFAVSDSALGMLPVSMLDALSPAMKEQLADIIRYHVVEGRYTSADLSDGMTLETLQGSTLTISVVDGALLVNGTPIVAADIEATNGVIHVINAVLMPPGVGAAAAAAEAPAEEAAAAEATPEPTEEAVAAEATAEPTEEAAAEAVAAEATPEPTEEAMAEAAMTEAPAEEAVAAEATAAPEEETAPEALPSTGGSTSGSTTTFAAVALILVVLAGAAFVTRRRQA